MLSSTRERIVGYAVDTLFGPGYTRQPKDNLGVWLYKLK